MTLFPVSVLEKLSCFDDVREAVAYVDTVHIAFFPRVPKDLFREVNRLSNGRAKIIPRYRPKPHFHRGQVLTVNQPTPEVLQFLAKYGQAEPVGLGLQSAAEKPCFIIVRVDIAVDFLCKSGKHSAAVHNFLSDFVRQKWRHNQKMRAYEGTTYFAPAASRRNVALYSDRKSRHGLGHVAHFEMRFSSAQTCRNNGLNDLHALAVGKIDAWGLLKKHYIPAFVNPDRFQEAVEKFSVRVKRSSQRHSEKTVAHLKQTVMRVLSAALQNEAAFPEQGTVDGVRVQDLYDSGKFLRPTLKRLSWDELTSPPRWVANA